MKKGYPPKKKTREVEDMKELLLKEVKLNGAEVQVFNLLSYRHLWLDAYRVAVRTTRGWELFEVVKWEEVSDVPTLLVRHVGTLSSLPVEVIA